MVSTRLPAVLLLTVFCMVSSMCICTISSEVQQVPIDPYY